ncbi:hypothetical protein, partial [Nonomuraea sp. NPDC005650]|uniref:hypothetical protein n=1 Tax=Nonomuraea sp. NPDC005650 TaxID=3157045 RepID=UPI0033A48849
TWSCLLSGQNSRRHAKPSQSHGLGGCNYRQAHNRVLTKDLAVARAEAAAAGQARSAAEVAAERDPARR